MTDPVLPSDAPDGSTQIRQDVKGDQPIAIGQMSGGNLFGNVGQLIQNLQQIPRSPESARYSLPPDPRDFTGREDEIQRIETDLKEGWGVAIAGMPGVGKSALAVRVAHRLKKQFPGGQIYLNLRGADAQPLSPDSALETLLRCLGVEPIPPDRLQQLARYRDKIAQSPTIVILDNAQDARQVADLLPSAGACLITSRKQVDGLGGVRHFNLEALPEAEALALFRKGLSGDRLTQSSPLDRLQAESNAARQIVNYCGRLPLALQIAAATLGMRSWQGKRLTDYAQQLADEKDRLNRLKLGNLDIRASFELSYRELDAEAAPLFGWLGLLPADFGTAILEPLTAQSPEAVEPALAALVDGRLVDPYNPEAGERYILHDLMRLFALDKLQTQAEPEAVQAAKGRLVQWCGEGAGSWANALNPVRRRQWAEALAAEWAAEDGNASPSGTELEPWLFQQARDWFEAERQTLIQAFSWAAETQQWQASVALAANLVRFFGLRSHWKDWVNTHQQALFAAQQAGDLRGEGQTLNNLGLVYRSQGKWNEAIDCYEQDLHICRTIGDVHGEGQTLNNLGNVYQSQGKWNEAIDSYQHSLQILRTIGDVHGEGLTLANLGQVHKLQKQMDQAIDLWQQALTKIHPDSPDYAIVTQWLQNATHPRRPAWQQWLLPLGVVLFLGWNLVSGHWGITLLSGLGLVGWLWFRRRRVI